MDSHLVSFDWGRKEKKKIWRGEWVSGACLLPHIGRHQRAIVKNFLAKPSGLYFVFQFQQSIFFLPEYTRGQF
jgi:hypothetical protein